MGGYGSGVRLHEDDVKKIMQLLKTTQLSMSIIAQRFGCTKAAVRLINSRFNIRDYQTSNNKSWKLV